MALSKRGVLTGGAFAFGSEAEAQAAANDPATLERMRRGELGAQWQEIAQSQYTLPGVQSGTKVGFDEGSSFLEDFVGNVAPLAIAGGLAVAGGVAAGAGTAGAAATEAATVEALSAGAGFTGGAAAGATGAAGAGASVAGGAAAVGGGAAAADLLSGGKAAASSGSAAGGAAAASGMGAADLLLISSGASQAIGLLGGGGPEAGAASKDLGRAAEPRTSTASREADFETRRQAAGRAALAAGVTRNDNEADLLGHTGLTTPRRAAGGGRRVLGY